MDFLSIYGAALATIVAVVQWRTRRTQLKLRINPGRGKVGEADDFELTPIEGDVVIMRITNRSEHPVKISMIGGQTLRDLVYRVLLRKESRAFFVARPYPLSLTLPIEIQPRDNVVLWFKRGDLDGDRRTVFSAYTADDRVKHSRPLRLSREPSMSMVS